MIDLNKISGLVKNVQELAKNLPLEKIFTPEFMEKNTQFKTIEAFLAKAGIDAKQLLNVSESKDAKLNGFVAENTNFGNWKDMYTAALSFLKK